MRRAFLKTCGILFGVSFLAGGTYLAWHLLHPSPSTSETSAPSDPRRSGNSPYKNIHPEVGYVGDAACAPCHPGLVASYQEHPMGRSLAPIAAQTASERLDTSANNPFRRFQTEFTLRRSGQRLLHQARRMGADGQTLYEIEAEPTFVMGSGTRGRSYLVEHDGFLFQSPISWFSQKNAWDISPGYAESRLFDRPIMPQCLYCHANDSRHVPGTVNRYEKPLFRQHAIGCERCHGPGELHVAFRERGEPHQGRDTTIVNPRHLSHEAREAVCEQCHLQGQIRIQHYGRELDDFRPGLLLSEFFTVFERIPKLSEGNKAVGHHEQLRTSRCSQARPGELGCISCHDPHRRPADAEQAVFYREKCLRCHQELSCALEPGIRRGKQPNDSCVACHMPRALSTDIAHTAVTDHRIPRKPTPSTGPSGPPPALDPGEVPIVAFHEGQDDAVGSRDLGVALAHLARELPQSGRFLAESSEFRLRTACRTHPDDFPSLAGLAFSIWMQGRSAEALPHFETLVKAHPEQEQVRFDLARLLHQLGQTEQALVHARKLRESNPWHPEHPQFLALLLMQAKKWNEASEMCRIGLRLSPGRLELRQMLVRSLLSSGQKASAQEEFEIILALNPGRAVEFRRWFSEQNRSPLP